MELKRFSVGLAATGAMLILILDGKTALLGAAEGIDLCMKAVIPALFPFFFLTPMLMGNLSPAFLKPMGVWMGLPKGTEGILIPAFLGGYPTGAQAVGQAWKEGTLTRDEAERMLHFCSNAGPSFLFGMIGPQFSSSLAPWLLWAVHMLSALLVCRCLPKPMRNHSASLTLPTVSMQQALSGAVKTMGLVCGWVVLFRIVITFLSRWIFWILPKELRVVVCGVLELSNGCCMLSEIGNGEIRFLVCSLLLAFGGGCVAMQTAAVIPGLSIFPYWKGKLMQSVFSLGLSSLLLPTIRPAVKILLILPSVALILFPRFAMRKNNSSNPVPSVV